MSGGAVSEAADMRGNAMNWSGLLKGACVAAMLFGLASQEAQAIEIVGAGNPTILMSDDLVMVRGGGGHAHRGGMHGGGVHRGAFHAGGMHGCHRPPGVHPGYRPGHRPGGVHPGYRPGYRPGGVHPGYRPGYRPGGVYRYGGWARPNWYRWGPGGAIAAGAAIGMVGAATAAAWAGPAPGPGLCWYYTDPSRRQGFWDACR
jgi:hypothetical protein